LPPSAAIVNATRQMDRSFTGKVSNSLSADLIPETGRVFRVMSFVPVRTSSCLQALSDLTTTVKRVRRHPNPSELRPTLDPSKGLERWGAHADGWLGCRRCDLPGWAGGQIRPSAASTALRPRAMIAARVSPSSSASSSDRERSRRSTLTEITLTPSPTRGRPGFAFAASQRARPSFDAGPKLSMTNSLSNSDTFRALDRGRPPLLGDVFLISVPISSVSFSRAPSAVERG